MDFTSGEFTWSDSRWVNLDECKACNVSQESSSAPLSPFSASASPQSSSSKSNPISSSSSTSSNDTKKYVAAKGGAEPGYCCKITTKTTALSNISLLAAAAVAAKGTCEEDKVSLEICQDLGATAGKDDNTEGRLFPTIIACDAACPNPCGNGKPDEGEKCDNGKSSELDPAKDPVCKDPNACGKTAAKTLAVNIPANVIKNYDVVTTKKLWKQAIIDADACNEKCEKVTKPVYCGDGILDKKGLDANEVDQPEEECDHGWYKNDKADVEPGGCDDRAMTCGKNGPNIPANIIAAYKAGEVLHKDWLKLINEKDACTFDCKNFKGKRGVMPKDKKDNNGKNQAPPPGGGGMPPGGGGGNPGNGGNQNVPNPPKDTTANPSNPSGDSCPSPNGMIDGQCYPPCKETIPAPYTCPVNCPSGPCPLTTPGPQKNCAYSCVASSASHSSSASVPKCGNGKVDSGEDCDNGLACTSGARQGTVCTSDNQCKSISAAHFCKMDMESHPIRGICDDGVTPCMSGIDCADTYPCGYNLLKDPSCNASCKRASSSSRSSLSSRASASSVHPACSILCSARSCFLCTSKNQQCIIPDMSKLPVSTATAQLLNGGGQAAGFDCASGSKTGFITCPCGGSSSSTSSIPRVAVCGNGRIDLGESCDNGGICTGEAIGNDGKMRICYKDSDCFVARGKCSAGTCSDGVPCNQDVDCIDQYDCLYNVGKDLTCSAQCKITGVSSSRSGGSTASIQSTSSKGASLISKGSVASVPSSLKSAFSSSRISSQSSSKISSSISLRSSAISSRSSTASRTKVCGNGRIDLGEQCDNGGACLGTLNGKICYQDSDCFVPKGSCTLGICSDGAPCSQNADCVDQYECAYNTAKDLTCSALCKRTSSSSSRSSSSSSSATGICGNGVINTGEECDDGSQNSWVPGAHCLPTCKLNLTIPLCGNRVIDGSEQCDDGNRVNNDGCSSVCTKEVAKALCGNGIIEAPEQCDIGSNNGKAGYSCSGSCTLITSGTTTSYGYSYSFPTGPSTTTTSISTTTTTPSLPSTTGNPAFCGNAVLNVGEQCDDGNAISGDGCSDSCKRETTMTTGNAFCGNGRLDAGEECDDANRRDLDGCSANCFLERGACGDGIVQHALGEQCEPTLPLDSPFYTCDTQCHFVLQFCGNGILDPGEECDEGLRNSDAPNATCRVHCTITRCGDRILDRGEECDDGNLVNGDGCDRFCFRESGAAISPSSSSPRPGVQPGTNPLPSVRPSLPGTPGQQGGSTLATLTPIATSHAPAGSTGPVTASVMAAGAAFGFAWMRRKGLKR
ncbi:MAG: DUF4215 domain-containing protein [Candidatus Peregrinibacteria bacterium]